jgi:hypothetical protein
LLAQGNVANKQGEDKHGFITIKRKEKNIVGKKKFQLIWIHVTNHWCEVEATLQTNAHDKEMEVDSNKEQRASKEEVEGHQIPLEIEEKLNEDLVNEEERNFTQLGGYS